MPPMPELTRVTWIAKSLCKSDFVGERQPGHAEISLSWKEDAIVPRELTFLPQVILVFLDFLPMYMSLQSLAVVCLGDLSDLMSLPSPWQTFILGFGEDGTGYSFSVATKAELQAECWWRLMSAPAKTNISHSVGLLEEDTRKFCLKISVHSHISLLHLSSPKMQIRVLSMA